MSCHCGWSQPLHRDSPSLQAQLDGICLGLVQGIVGDAGHWDGHVYMSMTQNFSRIPSPQGGAHNSGAAQWCLAFPGVSSATLFAGGCSAYQRDWGAAQETQQTEGWLNHGSGRRD